MIYNHNNIITPTDLKSVDTPTGRYYFTPVGQKYPSITTILSDKPKDGIEQWKRAIGIANANKEIKRSADRGTAIHLMIERLLNNEPNFARDQQIEHITEFNSLKMILKRVDNIVAQETALYSDLLKVAGRVDCIAEYNGVLSIIDFKTSSRDKKSDMIEDYFLQTTAYAIMFGEMYDIHINNIVIIMSVEQGLPLVFKQNVEENIKPLLKRINTYHNKKR